ncbi:MAG: CbiX/SirB N-terminal domain-containing protein [Acidobacteria bacterium]|nr:CbiX/SirB N-terminal domain-containing protein [Acidobacteriota bacterium]
MAEANEPVRAAAAELARRGGFPVEAAFLELAAPDLRQAVEQVVARGARRVLVVPYFLTLGIHLRRDLPRIAAEISRIYKNVRIEVSEPLEGHPALIEALLDRARKTLNGGGGPESAAG